MKRDAARTPPRSRSRKKTADDAPPAPVVESLPEPVADTNMNPLESGLSVAGGILLLVAALFPRTLKQLLLLGLGGGLLYRGMTSKCGVYAALGIDTARQPLLKQLNDKFLVNRA